MDLFQKCKDYTLLEEVKAAGIYPYFHVLESKQDTVVNMEGERKIMIGSNNYQGLTSDPRVIAAAVKATEEFGTGCSGSRFLNGTTALHIELEKELAEFIGKEDCVTVSTGFQTNLAVISAIAGRKDYIFCDKENHASIYDGCKLSYAKMVRFNHLDYDELERKLQEVPEDAGILIITDGIFSMTGDICDLPRLVEIKKKYGARLLVDDAHSLGVLGETGAGTAEYFGLTDEVDLICGTFSKSLASLGGYCACSKEVADFIRHNSRPFIFSASITPGCLAATLEALRIIKAEPERVTRLTEVAEHMRKLLRERKIKFADSKAPIIALFTYDQTVTLTVCKRLFEEGVYANPVLPPATPPGQCLVRTTYTTTHTNEELEEAADIIAKVFAEFDLIEEE
ncbi:MAG: pyridoxal phosphate-dependent aminotransferase family protein [Clostridia bacterium]|nr:pyridoxal phosphate-dependent aminotransferase family protein [Clostridia bacterium]